MKSFKTLCLTASFCLYSLHAAAGMAPQDVEYEESVGEVIDSVIAPKARAQSAQVFSVSLTGPNRIAVTGKKIINAIYDNTQLEVQTDALTGQIFVFPKTQESIALFVTAEDKNTYALTLTPQAIRSQEIVLESKSTSKKTSAYPQKSFAEPIEAAPNFESKLTRLMRALARDELPDGFHATNRCGASCLRSLASDTLIGRTLIHKNTSGSFVTLEEKLFYQKDVLAVAIVKPHLANGESTRVYVISSNALKEMNNE